MGKLDMNSFKETIGAGTSWLQSFKSVLWAFIFSFMGITIAALLFTYTPLGDQFLQLAAMAIIVMSVFLAGFINAKKVGSKGWLNGAFTGVLYMAVIFLISGLVSSKFPVDKNFILMLVTAVSSGILGGMFGVNAKN